MTESEFEEVDVEIVPKNQLQVIIKESNIEESLAQEFVINFEEHFRMAAEWAKKAKKIVVTNENQIAEMEEARTARLFLRSKRIEIENFRKEKKNFYLKAGQAIDKVANFLKDTIIPTEEHLERQEKFIEFKKKAEDERILAEAHAKEEDDRIKQEEEDRKERERIFAENQKLQKEIDIKNNSMAEERRKQIEELEKIRKENEAKLEIERKRAIEAERELLAKKQSEMKLEAEKQRQELILKNGSDIMKLQKIHDDLMNIDWPSMEGVKEKELRLEAMSHVNVGVLRLEKYLNVLKIEEEI